MSRRSARRAAVQPQQPQSSMVSNALANNAVADALISRADLAARLGQAFGGKRDYYEQFGYPKQLNYLEMLAWYKRGGIAKTLIDLPREKCWSTPPKIQEDENQYAATPFEKAYTELSERLNLVSLFRRADTLAGLGRYCAIVIGVKRPYPLNQPLQPGELKGPDDIVYLTPYSEINARIVQWETTDTSSSYYAKPVLYQVNIGAPLLNDATTAVPSAIYNIPVHASRIVHIANGCLEDEFYGTPDLEAVYNHFHDLTKVIGGGAEIYWLNARNGLKVKVDQGSTLDLESAEGKKFIEAIEAYSHQLKRDLFLNGADAQVLLNNQPIDPRGASQAIMEQIAAIKRIPMRILIGSERGEQASTQDRINLAETMMSRQQNECGPNIVLKFIKQLVTLGALPKPATGPFCLWEPLLKLDEAQKAVVALNKASATMDYLTHPEAQQILAPGEFRQLLGLNVEMSPEMAATIVALPAPPEPAQNLPALTGNVDNQTMTREELYRLEDRLMEALRALSVAPAPSTPAPSLLREMISTRSNGDLKEQITALTQQVQTALLNSASETQLNALTQQVEHCLRQLTVLASRGPEPTPAPTINLNLPESLKMPVPIVNVNVEAAPAPVVNIEAPPAPIVHVPPTQVTLQYPKETIETVHRDKDKEITHITRKVVE
jgi:hypothetical protein